MKTLLIIGLLLIAYPLFGTDFETIKEKVAKMDKTQVDTMQDQEVMFIVNEEIDKNIIKFSVITYTWSDVRVGNYNYMKKGKARTVPIMKKRFVASIEEK